MNYLEKLPKTIKYLDVEYELFIQKERAFGEIVWDITYCKPEYFINESNCLLYGFTGSKDLEDTAKSTLIRLEDKGFI